MAIALAGGPRATEARGPRAAPRDVRRAGDRQRGARQRSADQQRPEPLVLVRLVIEGDGDGGDAALGAGCRGEGRTRRLAGESRGKALPAAERRVHPDEVGPRPVGGGLVARNGPGLDVRGWRDQAGGVDRDSRMVAPIAPLVGDHVAGDAEEPDAERRGAIAVPRPRALLEAMEVAERGEECSL